MRIQVLIQPLSLVWRLGPLTELSFLPRTSSKLFAGGFAGDCLNFTSEIVAEPGCHGVIGGSFGMDTNLGGGFKYLLFSPLFGEDAHFD